MANEYGVSFNGRRIVHPGAYDFIDASAMTVTSDGSVNIPVVVGTADSGDQGKIMWFSNPESAREVLGGGDIPNALDLMFSPTPEGGGGASVVGVIVANQTIKATLTHSSVVITSKESGENGNRTGVKIEDGTISGSKKFTVSRWDKESTEVYDNLGAVIKIAYTGSLAYSALSVTHSGSKADKLVIKEGTDAENTTSITIDLARFSTVDAVIKHINSISDYSASYVDYKNRNMGSSNFDVATDVVLSTEFSYVMSSKGDLEYQVNNYSELVSVEVNGVITDLDSTTLSGGSKGTTPSSWVDAFDVIKTSFSDILVVLSSEESIHAEAATHVGQMEARNQKQIMFTGGLIGENIEDVKQRAATLNSSRVVLAYPGIYRKSSAELLAPYFTGALLAGRVAGVDASEPITFDYFNLIGLERELLAGDPDIDELLNAGVAVLERVQNGGIRLVQGITTYIGANNTLYREISVRRGADKLSGTMRKAMEDTFVGKKGLRATRSAVETKAIDILEQSIKDGDITAYRNIIVRFVGTVVYVDYEAAPVEPINFVLITSRFVPDSSFATN